MIIGLTGGMGSGKSSALRIFKEIGCRAISADTIAHSILKKDTKVIKAIIKTFGEGIIGKSGTINRKKLGRIVFEDDYKRKKLESIIHPAIIAALKREVAKSKSRKNSLIVEAPLLFEKKLAYLFDGTVVVYVTEKTAIRRLMGRDKLSLKEAGKRLKMQLPLSEKKKIADYVINNNTTIRNLKRQVRSLYKVLKKHIAVQVN